MFASGSNPYMSQRPPAQSDVNSEWRAASQRKTTAWSTAAAASDTDKENRPPGGGYAPSAYRQPDCQLLRPTGDPNGFRQPAPAAPEQPFDGAQHTQRGFTDPSLDTSTNSMSSADAVDICSRLQSMQLPPPQTMQQEHMLADRYQPPPGGFGLDPNELYASMREREKKDEDECRCDTTLGYLCYRTVVVDWMCEVCEEFKLSPYAVQLSAHYFDKALQRLAARKSELQLVATSCILIAAKFQGPEERVPQVDKLNACSKNSFTVDKIVDMEMAVLKALEWRTDILTPLHVADHLLASHDGAAMFGDTIDGAPLLHQQNETKVPKLSRRLRQFGEFFCRLILEDHAFYDFSVTELGAASIATARYVLAVGPIWPPALEERTGYSQALLTPCIQAILRYAAKRFPNKFVDVANAMSPKLSTPKPCDVSMAASPVDSPLGMGV